MAREDPRKERSCDQRGKCREWRGDKWPRCCQGDPGRGERQHGDPSGNTVGQVEEGRDAKGRYEYTGQLRAGAAFPALRT